MIFSFFIFIFQLSEVLDAMFERRVNAGDYIIRQGDDGDNFYVVDRFVVVDEVVVVDDVVVVDNVVVVVDFLKLPRVHKLLCQIFTPVNKRLKYESDPILFTIQFALP